MSNEPNQTEVKIIKPLCLINEPNYIIHTVVKPNQIVNKPNRNQN